MRHFYSNIFNRAPDLPSSSSSSSSSSKKPVFSKAWSWLSLLFGVLWIAPAIFVLSLSFQEYIVGRSIGCLVKSSKKCQLDLHAVTQIQQAQALAKSDEEAQAGFQIAAKSLEAWFCFICASLVWTMLKRLAGRDDADALPVGYLHVHTECQDLRLLPKLAWGRRRDANRAKGWDRIRLHIFIVFLTFTCILCNLMGPATAILVIPNIQWTPINNGNDVWFENVMAASRPLTASIARSCNEGNVSAGNYSCAYKSFGSTIDMVVAAAVATDDQSFTIDDQPYGNSVTDLPLNSLLLPPIMQEANVSFTVNISGSPFMWTPSRQTLRDISTDLTDYDSMTGNNPQKAIGYPQSHLFNSTLETRLVRRGPVLGQRNLCYRNKAEQVGIFPIGDEREVRCYDRFNEKIWKCIPWGTSWKGFRQAAASFTIGDGSATNITNSTVAVTIFSTSASLEMNHSIYETILGNKTTFDWATAFEAGQNAQRNLSGPQQIFEYRRIEPWKTQEGKNANVTDFLWCDSQTMLGLADYVLNPSQVSNTIRLVEMNVITEKPTPQPIFMHPEWSLAAWSVDRPGSINTVGKSRGASRNVILAMSRWVQNGDFSQAAVDFNNIHKFVAAHTLSLMPYSTTSVKPNDPTINPLLPRKAMIQVYKYDSKSAASKFAIAVLILGIICVVARTWLYHLDSEEMKDATEILVQALKSVNGHHRRTSSGTSNLLPTPELEQYHDEGSEDEKEFPIVQVKPVTPTDSTDAKPKRINYRRMVSFHG